VKHVKKTKKSQEVQHLPNTKTSKTAKTTERNKKKAVRKVKHARRVKIKNTGKIQKNRKRFNGRTFSILPLKGGYTLSNIPVSTMAFMQVLSDCGLVKYSGTNGAMKLDHAMLWAKFFNLKKVETKTRRFAGVICTDGCAVSVLLTRTETDYVGLGILSPSELRLVLSDPNSLVVGVDPGITDVATFAASDGTVGSYSGKRYYEDAKFNLSARRIINWNKETYEVTRFIPTPKTSSFNKLQVHVKAYLASFQTLLQHRASTGYRNMRFMRYVFKKKTITQICDMIAPCDKFVIVGFGDWRGPNGTPISRKCVGPLQDIRRALKSRNNVAMHEVNEAYSSQRCSSCHCDTVNMSVAGKVGEGKTTKIHKVLHCTQSSKDGTLQGIRCGKTFDRDFNASQNMLYLTRCFIKGWPRPERFQRPTVVVAPKKRQVRSKPS
jgi:transposase